MSLYLWIDILSISVPFLCSFHPKVSLHKYWKGMLATLFIAMTPYIIWDVYFTAQGYWGFTPKYLNGIEIFLLPIEEWLFFVCIPFACIFTHYSLLAINPKLSVPESWVKPISYGLFALFAVVAMLNIEKAYTLVDLLFGLGVLLMVFLLKKELLRKFFITFLVMLIPFFIVNGVLTGSFIEDQVVWYNDNENLGIRLFTIPIEDTVYAFSLLLLNLFVFERITGYKLPIIPKS